MKPDWTDKFVEFAKLMNVHLNHFPKHEKYALALEIRRAAYAVYGFIVESQKRYQKKTSLTNLDIEHEKLRMLTRLAFEMGYFEFKDGKAADKSPAALGEHRYLALSRLIDELGRMIGVNFVGYRTWASKRFIRRHSLFNFHRALKRGRLDSVVSLLGHAQHTHSRQHLINAIQEKNHGLTRSLSKIHHPRNHPRAASAGRCATPAPGHGAGDY